MKYFFRSYWLQVIAVFVSLFIGSRVIAMVFADIEGTGRLSTVADTTSEVSSELSSESSEVSSEESSDNPLDELFESTDWSDSLESSHTSTGNSGSSSSSSYSNNSGGSSYTGAEALVMPGTLPITLLAQLTTS